MENVKQDMAYRTATARTLFLDHRHELGQLVAREPQLVLHDNLWRWLHVYFVLCSRLAGNVKNK